MAHFVGKSALDIDGLGRKTVKLLMEHDLVGRFDDFFDLTRDELLALPSFKDKSADNLIAALETGKKVSLDRLLVGLSIDHVGEETAYVLAATFGTMNAIMKAREEELAAVKGIGDIVAASVAAWCSDPENQELITRLTKHLSIEKVEAPTGGPLQDQTVVITGTLPSLSREEAEALVRRAGGTASGSVSKKTLFVVAGESAGTKLNKAEGLGVEVIDEAEFKKRLGV